MAPAPDDAGRAASRLIARERLLAPGDRVLVAYSGGADSTALALVLDRLGYDVVLGHVDHGMREGSSADATRCREVARRLGLPFDDLRCSPPPVGEAAARVARYAALEAMADRAGAGPIATGHTLDDDAETVLLRMGRGGFPLGIPPRRGRVVRPLLGVRRSQTAALCASAGVPVIADPSNADERYARNRIRHRVLPALGGEGILALAALAESTRLAKARRDDVIAALVASVLRPADPGHGGRGDAEPLLRLDRDADPLLRLDRAALSALPPTLGEGVLRRVLAGLGVEPGRRLLRDLATKVVAVPGARLDLPGGLAAWADASDVVVGTVPARGALPSAPIRAPGRTPLEGWGIEVVVDEVPPPADPRTAPNEALLDATAARGPFAVRSRLPGDRYRPLGAPGERKLQDVLVDAKVPRAARDRVPLVTYGGRIAWVAGHRIDDAFRLTPSSQAAWRIQVFSLLP